MDEDSYDDENVCIIRRSILDHPAKGYFGYFSEFIQDACGAGDPKEHTAYHMVSQRLAVFVRCPPIVVRHGDEVRFLTHRLVEPQSHAACPPGQCHSQFLLPGFYSSMLA